MVQPAGPHKAAATSLTSLFIWEILRQSQNEVHNHLQISYEGPILPKAHPLVGHKLKKTSGRKR